jgi:hypothetical protein
VTGEYYNAMRDDEWQQINLKGANMSDDKTDPNWQTKLANATKRADPWFDNALESAKASAYTPWLVVGAVVLLIVLVAIVLK